MGVGLDPLAGLLNGQEFSLVDGAVGRQLASPAGDDDGACGVQDNKSRAYTKFGLGAICEDK